MNPGFGEATCTEMFKTKKSLGSAVPPADFVVGCDDVCAAARKIKEYWGSGDAADFACGEVASFGCVYSGAPPLDAAAIGC